MSHTRHTYVTDTKGTPCIQYGYEAYKSRYISGVPATVRSYARRMCDVCDTWRIGDASYVPRILSAHNVAPRHMRGMSAILILFQIWAYFGVIGFMVRESVATRPGRKAVTRPV